MTGTSSRHLSRCVHPPTDQIHQLWQIFTENVDPVTKIVHVPSLYRAIKKIINDTNNVPRNFSALLFAIYSIAILSLNSEECLDRFGQSRDHLLSHYISETKLALARADFTSTTSILVLQALIFHILCIRETHNPRSLWVFTGVAMRIAQGIGLHRDPTSLGLSPFEAEIRLRVWSYLKMHDERASELCGQPRFQTMESDMNVATTVTNINDEDLYPEMSAPPVASLGPTDIIFLVIKSEFFNFAGRMAALNRKNGPHVFRADDFSTKETTMPDNATIQSMEDYIENKYLRYCDLSNPIQFMTTLFARCALNVARFMAHHPRKWNSREQMPQSERDYVWNLGIKILEQFDVLQKSHNLQKFVWNSATYTQWHAFIHVLDTLRAEPQVREAAKAWRLVESAFENNPAILKDVKRPLYIAIRNLCLKAFHARQAGLFGDQNTNQVHQVPAFIQKIQESQEHSKSQVKSKGSPQKRTNVPRTNIVHGTQSAEVNTDFLSVHGTSTTQKSQEEDQLFASGSGSTLSSSEPSDSSFWLTHDVDMSGFDTFDGLLETSIDSNSMGDIDWGQWDNWLSGTNFVDTTLQWAGNGL